MPRQFSFSGLLAVGLLLAPSPGQAQQPPPSPPPNIAAPQPSPDPKAAVESAPVTLTGCIERSKPSSLHEGKGTPATSMATDPPTAYVLRTEAIKDGSGSQGPVYNLIALDQTVKLDQHIGHRVQISGAIRPITNQQPGMPNLGVSPSTPSGSTAKETMPKPEGAGATAMPDSRPSLAQPVFVQSLKMLDGECKSGT